LGTIVDLDGLYSAGPKSHRLQKVMAPETFKLCIRPDGVDWNRRLRGNPALKRRCLQIVHMWTMFLHGEFLSLVIFCFLTAAYRREYRFLVGSQQVYVSFTPKVDSG
jgi:hypothetical protein